jgi:hypothetical protein
MSLPTPDHWCRRSAACRTDWHSANSGVSRPVELYEYMYLPALSEDSGPLRCHSPFTLTPL